jgi:hypothetical protein
VTRKYPGRKPEKNQETVKRGVRPGRKPGTYAGFYHSYIYYDSLKEIYQFRYINSFTILPCNF